jgi:asparagine synthase (glutamine-hydrolysing)
MCGIAGKFLFDRDARVRHDEIEAMLHPMRHRGPDGEEIYLERNIGLGHLRLSIIDLETGGEPMPNEDKTVWIIFNGEIYNFQELRERLLAKGHIFRSKSDTEVIIHLYEDLGPECVQELRGMFAFAIWDSKRQRLFLARDRVGIKPLYYSGDAQGFRFASELKGVVSDPVVSREIDLHAVRTFLSFNYVPGEATLFRAIRKLLPGHYIIIEDGKLTQRQYWDLRFESREDSITFEDAVDELYSLLASTVARHMIADVPVGVLLSGGVDSSAVLSFAVNGTKEKLRSFTVGFENQDNGLVDERPYARMSAQRFGTEHYETSISAADFWDFLPSYVWHMEEPVCEPPAIALYYVSKLARNYVKVLLSGEGGDEAFAGYPNYPNMLLLERFRRAIGPLAHPAGAAISLVGSFVRDGRVARYGNALGRSLSSQYFSRTSGPTAFFNRDTERFFTPEFFRTSVSSSAERLVRDLAAKVSDEPLLNQMLYIDTKTWLPDDLLVKADKMTMANSLELRVPLLDHKVLEFAASLPPECKVRGRQTKRVLKATFAKALPEEILNRKKAGFPVPYQKWLRNELKERIEAVLLSKRATARGYSRENEVSRLLRANFRDGIYSKEIFSLLILELWHRQFVDGAPTRNPTSGSKAKNSAQGTPPSGR